MNSPLKLVLLGHVDHGKSTLIGRLLHETGALAEGKYEAVQAACRKRGQPFEWAFVTDALQAERNQNVTIDISHIRLRDTLLIDAPGHREFLQNMATGAADADAALIVIDAMEGVGEQTRRHAALLPLLGIKPVIVVVTKMDKAGYKKSAFDAVAKSIKNLGIKPVAVIPISAREGDNVAAKSARMKWYNGPHLLAAIKKLKPMKPALGNHLRLKVQDVYKSGDRRIIAGRIESGALRVGDTVLFSPSGARAKVNSIVIGKKIKEASAGRSVGITLDQPIFVERGQIISHEKNPPAVTNLFRAHVFWLDKKPLAAGESCTLNMAAQETQVDIRRNLAYGETVEIAIRTRGQIAVDAGARFVLLRGGVIVGGGVVLAEGLVGSRLRAVKSKHLSTVDFGITSEKRAAKNGHFGGVIWFTGLSSAGKSTIARLAQQRLFDLGCQVFVLDGDNIRQGLSRDLGFSARERRENIRRIGEVAALFAQAGMIAIAAFISPYRADREQARGVRPDDFHEIYIKASLKTCEKRDAKGLYKKARAGKIPDFTGVSAPYEAPDMPDLVLDTDRESADACAARLVEYITQHLITPARAL